MTVAPDPPADDCRAEADLDPGRLDLRGDRFAHRGVVGDATGLDVQRGDAGRVGLDRRDLAGAEHLDVDAVQLATPVQLVEAGELVVVGRPARSCR